MPPARATLPAGAPRPSPGHSSCRVRRSYPTSIAKGIGSGLSIAMLRFTWLASPTTPKRRSTGPPRPRPVRGLLVRSDCEDSTMEVEIGRGKKARQAYGFDDIAIVPSRRTRDPDDIDISWKLGPYQFELPMLAAAMDGVVSPRTAGIIGGLGGLAVLNLEGIFTRYEDAEEQLERIASLPKEIATREMQEIYAEPVKPELIAQRIGEIKEQKVVVAASLTPQRVIKYHEIAMEAGLDVLVIQGTVVS